MTKEDEAVLIQQDSLTLAEWHCQLNQWKWPHELPNPEEPTYIPDGRRIQIMDWINRIIGMKLCVRVWNKDSMNDEQFEDFWKGHLGR